MHAPYYIVICGMCGSTIFSTLSHKTEFSENVRENEMSVLFFSTSFLATFFILRRIQRDIITHVRRSSCKVPVILLGF